jgi:hypothetical protein
VDLRAAAAVTSKVATSKAAISRVVTSRAATKLKRALRTLTLHTMPPRARPLDRVKNVGCTV